MAILKKTLEDAPLLRGSRDFGDLDAYRGGLSMIVWPAQLPN